ncbi:hypothetical protein Rumeso_02791 [Rubellimicrobium mesophilum DSM 19309]|uniref:Uncharacterized protein n=1 Tax=Rubellimicrobium mesophilum DSM 19309 TaxID=442562 RepID=A0A017HPL2_9RHOB|nr:hypothetical protein Rumeso_02791 [Rubellimicrobium mesophilum DSM 19309]
MGGIRGHGSAPGKEGLRGFGKTGARGHGLRGAPRQSCARMPWMAPKNRQGSLSRSPMSKTRVMAWHIHNRRSRFKRRVTPRADDAGRRNGGALPAFTMRGPVP